MVPYPGQGDRSLPVGGDLRHTYGQGQYPHDLAQGYATNTELSPIVAVR
ncbi:MAG: hypothetical protein ACKO21_06165 [Nodosilinea sp.]